MNSDAAMLPPWMRAPKIFSAAMLPLFIHGDAGARADRRGGNAARRHEPAFAVERNPRIGRHLDRREVGCRNEIVRAAERDIGEKSLVDRKRRTGRASRLEPEVGEGHVELDALQGAEHLSGRVRARKRAVCGYDEVRRRRVHRPSLAAEHRNVDAVHFHAVRCRHVDEVVAAVAVHPDASRRCGSVKEPVKTGRKPEMYPAGGIGIDIVRAVAHHAQINPGIRREAVEHNLVHLTVAVVDRNGVAAVAIVEILF